MQVSFDPDDQVLLEQVSSGWFASLANYELNLRARRLSLIDTFETLLCLPTLYPIFPADPLAGREEGSLPPLEPAYIAAGRAISCEASAHAEELRRRAERLLVREIQRIDVYFDAYEDKLQRRLASGTDPARAQRLQGRLAGARQEHQAKVEDVRRKC